MCKHHGHDLDFEILPGSGFSNRCASKLPTPNEKQVLQNAGLGLKKIKFDRDEDNEDQVYGKLMADDQENDEEELALGFPKLKDCGGFELMRCIPNCRVLEPLKCNMDAKSLKMAVGQGKVYIRPIQKSLSVLPLKKDIVETSRKEKCLTCLRDFGLQELREHIEMCSPLNIH